MTLRYIIGLTERFRLVRGMWLTRIFREAQKRNTMSKMFPFCFIQFRIGIHCQRIPIL